MHSARLLLPVIACALLAIVALNVVPYRWNPTIFFHLDAAMHERQPVPPGFVVLDVPAYDGAHYYQIARNIPKMMQPSSWAYLRTLPTYSYAYQRFLLPLAAFTLSLGWEAALPYAFLFLNLAAILIACSLVLTRTAKPLYALGIALCPSAMVALHFSLAEPLTLAILALFLTRFSRNDERLDMLDILLLSLLTWSREVNILFAGLLCAYLVWKRQWKDAVLATIPLLAFTALHGWIWLIFGNLPFLTSAGKRTLPFEAMIALVTGGYGYNRLTLTSIPLAALYVAPALCWVAWMIIKNKDRTFLAIGSLAFLGLMTTMPDYIWGSITSIGRVITPVYPLTLLLAAKHDTPFARYVGAIIPLIGLGAAIALALVHHPYTLA